MRKDYDLIVLGGGPAGYVGAFRAAQLGARVALVEEDKLGGTCLNRGCIPTKVLVEASRMLAHTAHLRSYGITVGEVKFDLSVAMKRKNAVVQSLVKGLHTIAQSYSVDLVKGTGKVTTPGEVVVGETTLTAPRLLLATGSAVAVPPIPGVDGPGVITSNEALELENLPKRLVVIGGGVIGIELAGILAAMGSQVTVLEALPRILMTADPEIVGVLQQMLERMGVQVLAGAQVERIDGEPGAKRVVANGQVFEADLVLVATGRRPRLEGLDGIGLQMDRKGITTNRTMLTNLAGVAAAGDIVAGTPMLAHVASHEAKVAVENLLGHSAHMDYRAVPQCVFGPVDLASVGMTEEEARTAGHTVKIGRFPFAASGRAATLGDTRGLVKVVSEARYGAVLGVHMVGPHVSELLGEAGLAVQMETTLAELTETMHMHPTLSEAVAEAGLAADFMALHLPRERGTAR